jgi:hypothetical protein
MIRILDLDPAQADALRDLMRQAESAQERLTLAFSMVVRGHGIIEASAPVLNGTQLSVTVPEDS